jgi:hypothetical protein
LKKGDEGGFWGVLGDVPKGVAMKHPRALFIPLWRLSIFGITETSHYFQQWALSSDFAKDKDLTPESLTPETFIDKS